MSTEPSTTTLGDAPKGWESIKYFKPSEFDSPDQPGSGIKMNLEFVKIIDWLRGQCGFPFKINSGYRTQAHNTTTGGVSESAHTQGVACDIEVENGRQRYALVKYAMAAGIKRIGVGRNFVHLDFDYGKPQEVIWTYYEPRS